MTGSGLATRAPSVRVPPPLKPWQGAPWEPRRWQAEALPIVLAALGRGERPVVRACTGGGKSVLTAELAHLARVRGRTVVLAVPTEALVEQSAAVLAERGIRVGRWYGRRKERAGVTVCCYPSLGALLDDLAARKQRVDLLIADECHGTEAERRRADLLAADARWMVGLTATPYRADEREALSLWSGICYEYGIAQAMEDGVLVPIEVREAEGDDRTLVDDALEAMYRALPTRPNTGRIRPGVVSAISVDDAESYVARLRRDGWRAEAVHYRRDAGDVARAIRDLQRGQLDMLVHVAMLSEGVDLPWLWWLALRRPTSSRVRLVQEVGRVVRVDREDTAKTVAIVLDPHGICASTGLVHEARVGQPQVIDETEPGREEQDDEGERVPMTLEGRTIRVRYSDAERAWRELAAAMEIRGLLPPGTARGRWTRKPATQLQRIALQRMRWATRHLPDLHREPWRRLIEHPRLTAGCASDLLGIIHRAADGGREARDQRRRWVLELTEPDSVIR